MNGEKQKFSSFICAHCRDPKVGDEKKRKSQR